MTIKKLEIVTLLNLHECYTDHYRNLYVEGEIVDGFTEDEVRHALENGCFVYCR